MASVDFDKRLYNLKAVKAAAREYGGFADFSITVDGHAIRVVMENIDYQPEELFLGEFSNYVIHKMGESL